MFIGDCYTAVLSRLPYLSRAGTVAILGAALCLPANAQDNSGIEEIVVTARKREENLQDTPVSVTVFTAKGLDDRAISNLAGIDTFTPNLDLSNGRADGGSSTAQFYIRGVGQSDYLFPNDPGVGLYVDGVYLARTVGGMLSLDDIERIEVLRGPQGTLYGKNTIGGAVNVFTARPSDRLEGRVKATIGSFDRTDLQGTVHVPLIKDTLSSKLSMATLNRDGFVIRNFDGVDLGNEKRNVAHGKLLFTPRDDIEFLLAADYTNQRQNGAPGNLQSVFPSDTGLTEGLYNPVIAPILAAQLGLPPGSVFDDRWITGDTDTSNGTARVHDDADIWGISMTAGWSINDTTSLKSITAYREIDAQYARDSDSSPFPIISTDADMSQEQFSQELQLSGASFDGRLNWLLGVFYSEEDARELNDVNLLAGTLLLPPPFGFEISLQTFAKMNTQSYAAFAHGSYQLTPALSLTAGVRYTLDDKEYLQHTTTLVTQLPVIPERNLEESWDAFSPKVGIEYHYNDNLLLYTSYASGFKSGGWNPRPTQPNTGDMPFDPEYLDTVEVGVKSAWLDRRLIANISAFFSKYDDVQITVVIASPGPDGVLGTLDDGIVGDVSNAAKVELYGFELELAARPTIDWDIELSAGFLEHEYKKLDPSVPFSINNKLPDAPKWNLSLSVARHFEFGDYGLVTLRGDAGYKSSAYNEPFNFDAIKTEAYWVVNGGLIWESANEKWRANLTVSNIFDEEYLTNAINGNAFGYHEGYYGRPREVAFSVSRSF